MEESEVDTSSQAETPSEVSKKVPFAKVCGLIERVSRSKGVEAKKSIIRKFADEWRQLHSNIHGLNKTADSFFPVMRLLLPQCDKSRLAYGIKEHSLAKLYIEILCLGKDSPDALKLLNYKSPKHARNSVGDFAEVVFFVLKNRCPEEGSLTVEDVNSALTDIAEGNAEKGTVRKQQIKGSLMRLLKNTSAIEQKWLVRMLMKDLKCGVSHTSIMNAFHEDAEALFDVSQNLEKVCQQLHDPKKRLHEVEISLFSPFRPMLADRGYPARIEQQMGGRKFILETKFDGERMQLHKEGDHYRYWSRNGFEWTDSFGQDPYHGNLTPYIHKCFLPGVKSCILDGEMMGYNMETASMGSKAQDFDIKRSGVEERTGYVPCLIVFDIVFFNGQVLSNKAVVERKRHLDECFRAAEGRLMHSVWEEANGRDECAAALNRAVDGREEGVMAKRVDSIYAVANRKGGWFKLKPEYVGGMMDELDCLIVGGFFGSGQRAGMVSHFLLAVAADEPKDEAGHPTKFHTLCKVGSGYSKQALVEYNRKMAPHWRKFDRTSPPSWLKVAREKPDLWIEPRESCLVQVKASEIIASDSFYTNCTLRFPRVECFREDKSWHDCMTVSELSELRKANEGKLAARHVDVWAMEGAEGEEGEPSPKRKKTRGAVKPRPAVASRFLGIDAEAVEKLSDVLSGHEVCVMSAGESRGRSKAELEEKVVAAGGNVVQNPGLGTFVVIADKVNVKVRNLIQKGNYDIVSSDWLVKCCEERRFLHFRPDDIVHATTATKKMLADRFDLSGDSFTHPVESEVALAKILDKVKADEVDEEEIKDLVHEHFVEEVGVLYSSTLYFDDKAVISDVDTRLANAPFDLLRIDAKRKGGVVDENLKSPQVSHVIVDPSWDNSRIDELREVNSKRKKRFHLVTREWLSESLDSNTAIDERKFAI